jgi:hypothetical protein
MSDQLAEAQQPEMIPADAVSRTMRTYDRRLLGKEQEIIQLMTINEALAEELQELKAERQEDLAEVLDLEVTEAPPSSKKTAKG